MLIGSYGSLVKDNTIKIPKKLQKDFKSNVVVTFDTNVGCIVIIPEENLPIVQQKFKKSVNNFETALNNLKRFSFAEPGIFKIDANFLNLAGITKECVFLGMQDYLELWDKEKFATYFSNLDTEYIEEQLKKLGF